MAENDNGSEIDAKLRDAVWERRRASAGAEIVDRAMIVAAGIEANPDNKDWPAVDVAKRAVSIVRAILEEVDPNTDKGA